MTIAVNTSPDTNGVPKGAPPADPRQEGFPEPGTEAWVVMNRRRGELIHKKVRGILPPEEVAEYERLQRLSQAALERAFPAPTLMDEEIARIEARLAHPPEGGTE